ncbi:MAG: succinate dehydrogenase [Chloroflexi bacterium]|jgi:succinate dehydrogenase / fumarate reductase iron-sulfur subunit|nr:succinate dehydrogenase [Chloroflexota bacterium]|tara:strand:+ start:7459 stop:8436 length:978 start_codon:yes stop_codon:yes gene_type:complete
MGTSKEGVLMNVNLKVKRFDPADSTGGSWWQEYNIDIHQDSTVLDALIHVREYEDTSLALRCACRASICGSCGMKVNGSAKLVCKTRIVGVSPNGEQITVEPMGNQPVIKDLVVSLDTFFNQVKRVEPYMQPDFIPDSGEYIASNESMENLLTAMNCIMCGCCVSDCTVLEVDDNFIGPAALAKAWRFVDDPRDSKKKDRLKDLNYEDGGIWDCTRCMQCVEVCPKGVNPMERIMELRDQAIEIGFTNTNGARHAEAVYGDVGHSGWLDELRLPIKTFGMFNFKELIKLIPIGIKSQLVGKRPPIFHKSIPGVENIRKIFERYKN